MNLLNLVYLVLGLYTCCILLDLIITISSIENILMNMMHLIFIKYIKNPNPPQNDIDNKPILQKSYGQTRVDMEILSHLKVLETDLSY